MVANAGSVARDPSTAYTFQDTSAGRGAVEDARSGATPSTISRSRRVDHHVGERIRLRRTELGLTQEQLAEALDVSYQQVQKYETGANRISAGRIFEIARKLRVDISYFFDGLSLDEGPTLPPEHGGRHRAAIELVRKFAQIEHPEVRSAIAGLVKTIVDRDHEM